MSFTQTSASEITEQVKALLLDEPGLKLAMVFGSTASGTMRADSDIDLAVLYEAPLTAAHKIMLTSRLEGVLRRNVDLVDLYALSGTILKQILCKGRILIRDTPEDLARQVRKMIYNQADMMPYVRRTLNERQRRFVYG